MSYPSINKHLENQGTTLEAANDDQISNAFIAAFKEDLPLGWACVEELVGKLKSPETGERVMVDKDPSSPEGMQFARLLGPDIPRKILSDYHGVSFGFYNCCKGVAATTQEDLNMTMREQIESQAPNFVNC